jgi:hypothetical protein
MSNILILKKLFSKLTAIILSNYKDYQIMHVLKKVRYSIKHGISIFSYSVEKQQTKIQTSDQ